MPAHPKYAFLRLMRQNQISCCHCIISKSSTNKWKYWYKQFCIHLHTYPLL